MTSLMTPLANHIRTEIKTNGPMDIARFMGIALGHPQHGYYMKQDPFGRDGDFTTAPEISQLFGEMIGAWIAALWMQMGNPPAFTLLECGPGRGTLMADIMRITRNIPGFHDACSVHLLETSPTLKEKQAAVLATYEPVWHSTLKSVPVNAPHIVIANEFLDALPVQQLEKTADGWAERCIDYDDERGFHFVLQGVLDSIHDGVPACTEGQIFEVSHARDGFTRDLAKRLVQSGGAALIMDYGHTKTGAGDTLQAVRKHEYTPVLDHIGNADLTAHVDFQRLSELAKGAGVRVSGPVEQGQFLRTLGIEYRAEKLKAVAETPAQEKDIETALQRLTSSGQMGRLFKITGLFHGYDFTPAGF